MQLSQSSAEAAVLEIYSRLLSAFGSRKWWPSDTREETIIGAVLAQNVSWRNVEKAIANLKHAGMLSLQAVHTAESSLLAELIKPTRFYNQKAEKLKNFTQWLYEDYKGSLDSAFSQDLEDVRREMLTINGLGQETVDSILLYAGGKSIFVVDAYTKRIFYRLGLTDIDWSYSKLQTYFMQNIKADVQLYNDYHAQIVRLGNAFCRKSNPNCGECPLRSICDYTGEAGPSKS
ncbi:endonuclease III domain-containing protein [Chloroflexota bacterium]